MAHHYSNSLYDRLADRLNQFPQGAPLSDSLFAILKILFSEKEAGLVAQLPIKPFTIDRAAAIWKLDKATAQNMLEDLAGRAMLLDMEQNGRQMFCLPPPMAGFSTSKRISSRRCSSRTGRRLAASSYRKPRSRRTASSRSSITSALHTSSGQPRTSASACATAAIKCSISGGRVMPQWTSA